MPQHSLAPQHSLPARKQQHDSDPRPNTPTKMDIEYMDLYRRQYADMNIQHYNNQQGGPQGHYPMWNHQLMAMYQQQQHRAAMIGQSAMHASKQTEPKPRLAKDEVDLLEREFTKNPKPNSSTKRELAEQMGVEVPRINNWFQNRRAKEKQMRKAAEFEAQQARERVTSDDSPPNDGKEDSVSALRIELSTARFENSVMANDGGTAASEDGLHDLPDGQGRIDLDMTAALENHSQTEAGHHLAVTVDYFGSRSVSPQSEDMPAQAQPDFYMHGSSPGTDGVPTAFDEIAAHSFLDESRLYGSFASTEYFHFPPPMMDGDGISTSTCSNEMARMEDAVQVEQLSPVSISEASVMADLELKSPPPPTDIAGRRKMRRPAPLGLSSSSSSIRSSSLCHGPRSNADVPRRCEAAKSMRRIASATGSLYRIQKQSAANAAASRSSLSLDRNKETLLHRFRQRTRSPVVSWLSTALPPMSPETMSGQEVGEKTASNTTSDEEPNYTFGSLGLRPHIAAYRAEVSIKTPPGTPGIQLNFSEPYFTSLDTTWPFQEDRATTPSLCSHGSELDLSAVPQLPGYVASQPVTPSFAPTVGPTYNGLFSTGLTQNTEYTFPDSYQTERSARSSPGRPTRSKQQFQFAQNITPQDFNADR